MCGSMWSDIESTYSDTMLLCRICYSVRLCIVHVSTAIIYWQWIWLVWHVGDCGVHGWKNTGMGVRKGTVVLFIPTLFGCFLGILSPYVL